RFERVWGPDGVREDRTPDGRRLRYQHDATGRVEAVDEIAADGEVRTHRYQRDAEGRVVGVDGPGGTRLRYTLLPEGQPTLIEQDGRKAQRRYDAGGALIEHVDPLGRAARVTVDLHRQPTEVSLPGGLRWRFTRDRLGHVTRMEAPDGSITRYTRDAVGRPVAEDRAGEVVKRRFDACGQVTRLKDAAGGELRLSYDALGRLVRAEADDDAPVERRYDPDGNLAAEVQGEAVLRWRYDALGHALGRRTSWGGRVDYLWGAAGVDSLVDPAGETHRFDRDVRGRRVAWERPGGGVERDVFSPGGHLERTWLEIPGQPAAADRRLFWSPEGTITGLHEAEDDRSTRHEYRYDGLGRLVGERRNDGPWRPYVHDDRDNLVDDPAQGSRTFDGVRLVQAGEDVVRHDRRARREAVTHGDGTRTTWWYDRRGRLARVHTRDDRIVHHRYDALGRRVETVAEVAGGVRREALVWDGDQLARRVVTTAAGQREEEYVYDPQRQLPLLRVVRAGGEVTSQYYQVDQRGAAIRLTDAAGQQLWRGRYEPYGGCAEEGPEAGEQPLRLAGQVEDAATGLCHHRHRVYDPDRRSFLTADPLGLDAGLNPFAFPSDPVQFADPLGLARCGQGELMLGSELTEPIYFGQARIAGRFADIGSPAPDSIRGRPIEAVAADLRAGRIAGEDLPVQVFRDPTTGRLTAINNRGLAAWSLAGRNPDLVILTTPTAAETNRLREPSLVRGDSLPSPHTAVTPGKNDTSIIGIVSTPGNATPPGYPAYPSE
ncbi:MAG: RHS domain-containing protein, partial [Myxococcales bacterium]|nr:RHS domain-containing protein [Myxococcales bacterium]